MNSLELWGGYECTVNRVGNEWFDQTPRSGHENRLEDLQLFADLGLRSLRYPVLWERISPAHPDQRDFRWSDERLQELQRLGINPILTLCHHGSGPHYTSLIENSFAPGLAAHAAAVAARYPWVRDWTPVNEPLTTARFSAMYGLWYPHTTDERLFWTALLNEIDATRLAMREIRKVNPAARLIQTDDLGYCHSTEPLQEEADFQNERRWAGWDLLCGMVVPGHALFDRIAGHGLAERLAVIAADPCPPEVIGINHYLSSERLIDHRVDRYPNRSVADRTVGLVAGVPKVDVDAVRHRDEGVLGLPALIQQAWERYGRTIAITECHNGATREEQVRWFVEVWEGAEDLRRRGVDLCAVTAWSLLGSHDWNRMVTRFVGHYETGVYDVRTGTPRPTLLASVLKDLAAGRKPDVPAIAGPGWWRRDSRLIHAVPNVAPEYEIDVPLRGEAGSGPLLIVNGDTELGRLAVRACELRGLRYLRCDTRAERALIEARPWAVFDAWDHGGVCQSGARPRHPDPASTVSELCASHEVPLAFISGSSTWDHSIAQDGVLEVRTEALFMPWDQSARAVAMLRALDSGRQVTVTPFSRWSQVYGPDLMDVLLDLLLDGVTGTIDGRFSEQVSEQEFARVLAHVADVDPNLIRVSARSDPQPGIMRLNEVSHLPPLETTLERFVRECRTARSSDKFAMGRNDIAARLDAAE